MKFLIVLAQRHEDFRLSELDAVLEINGLNPRLVYQRECYRSDLPYLVAELPNESAARCVLERGILVKALIELWAEAPSIEELASVTKSLPLDLLDHHVNEMASWSLSVEAFGRSLRCLSKPIILHLGFLTDVPPSIF